MKKSYHSTLDAASEVNANLAMLILPIGAAAGPAVMVPLLALRGVIPRLPEGVAQLLPRREHFGGGSLLDQTRAPAPWLASVASRPVSSAMWSKSASKAPRPWVRPRSSAIR